MATITVSKWSDFLSNNTSSRESSDVIYFADANVENGVFIGQGTGTRDNPYICGTYNEMIVATGARYLYNLQLVEGGEDEHDMKLYWCNGKYARHDRTNTTIDLNLEGYTSGINDIIIYCIVNFNGWTLQNFKFYNNAGVIVKPACAFRRAICINWMMSTTVVGSSYFNAFEMGSDAGFTDNIMQLSIVGNTSDSRVFLFLGDKTAAIYNISMYRNTFTLYVRAAAFAFGYNSNSAVYTTTYYDTVFDLDVDVYSLAGNTNGSDASIERSRLYGCIIKGNIHINNTSTANRTNVLCRTISASIVDCTVTSESTNTNKLYVGIGGIVATVANSDKVQITSSTGSAISVTSAELLQPNVLRQKGFPIGSD